MRQNHKMLLVKTLAILATIAACKKNSSEGDATTTKASTPSSSSPKASTPSSSSPKASISSQASTSKHKPNALKSCTQPAIFEEPKEASISFDELKIKRPGNYELNEVHIYHMGKLPDGTPNGAFYGKATRFNKVLTEKELDEISDLQVRNATRNIAVRQTDLTTPCEERPTDVNPQFISGATVTVPHVIHFPSGRVTIYDEYSNFDNSRFNFPALADVHFDSIGTASYKNQFGSGPPYLTNRYLQDWVEKLPNKPQIFLRKEGFEFRFQYEEPRTLNPGNTFQVHTFVIISYQPNLDKEQSRKPQTAGSSPLVIFLKQEGKDLLWEAKNQGKTPIWVYNHVPVAVKPDVFFGYPVWFKQEGEDVLLVQRTPPPWRDSDGAWMFFLKPNQVKTGKVHLGVNQFTANFSRQPSTTYDLHQIIMEIAWSPHPLPKTVRHYIRKEAEETFLIADTGPPLQTARSMPLVWDTNIAKEPPVLPKGVFIAEDQVLDPSPNAKNQKAQLFTCKQYRKEKSASYISCKEWPAWFWEVTADYETYQTSDGKDLQEVSISRFIDATTGKVFSETHQGWPTISH